MVGEEVLLTTRILPPQSMSQYACVVCWLLMACHVGPPGVALVSVGQIKRLKRWPEMPVISIYALVAIFSCSMVLGINRWSRIAHDSCDGNMEVGGCDQGRELLSGT